MKNIKHDLPVLLLDGDDRGQHQQPHDGVQHGAGVAVVLFASVDCLLSCALIA